MVSKRIVDHPLIILNVAIQASTGLSTASSLISVRNKRARKNTRTRTRARPGGHAFRSRRVSLESRAKSVFRPFSILADFDFVCPHYDANNKRPVRL